MVPEGEEKVEEEDKAESEENEPGESAEFEIILDELKKTYEDTLTKDIPEKLLEILIEESKDENGNSTFKDAKEPIASTHPAGLPQGNGVHRLDQDTSYGGIGRARIRMGISPFEGCYNALMGAGKCFQEDRCSKFSSTEALVFPVIAISEALRFLLLQAWIIGILSTNTVEPVPKRFYRHFQSWENHSFRLFTEPNPELIQMLGILKKNSRVTWPPSESDLKEKEKPTRRLRIKEKNAEDAARLELLNDQRKLVLDDNKLFKQMRGFGWKRPATEREKTEGLEEQSLPKYLEEGMILCEKKNMEKGKITRRLRIEEKTAEGDVRLSLINEQKKVHLDDDELKQMKAFGRIKPVTERENNKGHEKVLPLEKPLEKHLEEGKILHEQEQPREFEFKKQHHSGDLQEKSSLP